MYIYSMSVCVCEKVSTSKMVLQFCIQFIFFKLMRRKLCYTNRVIASPTNGDFRLLMLFLILFKLNFCFSHLFSSLFFINDYVMADF